MPKATPIHKPRLFAHRGTSLLAPENTKAAFDLCLAYKADVIETDVRLSKDGIVMVTHDETLERTTNGQGLVRDLNASELQRLDASTGFIDCHGEPYTGEIQRLITLDELLVQYRGVGVNIDIKDKDTRAADAVAKAINQHEIQYQTPTWINVGSFHADTIAHFRTIAPHISTAATRQEVARLVFGSAKRIDPHYRILQIPTKYWGIQLTGARLMNKVHRLNCEIVYWTINNSKQMQRLIEKGCDGIVTDRPDLALLQFEQAGIK